MIRLIVNMRVIHVVPTPFGSAGLFGGGERYPLELARAMAGRVDCQLITFSRGATADETVGSLRIRTIRSWVQMRGHPAHPVAPGLVAPLRDADVIHTHHMHSAPSRIAALTARMLGKPAVTTDHGLQGGDWGGVLPRLFERFLCVSAYSARVLRAPPLRTSIIYGGADTRRFAPDSQISRAGILFVGRITPHKGVDRLIEALPLRERLTIAGSIGHDRHSPENDYPALLGSLAMRRDVKFMGPIGDELLPDLYRSAKVLALPSVHRTCYGRDVAVSELLGLVILEAMSSGTPVVCSALGGLPEIVQQGVTGYLVEPGNTSELRERLTEIVRDPGLAMRMGRNARDLVQERFTWEACADRCLPAYEDVVRRRPGRPSG